jgi:L,D-transpeptidase YcbB
MRRILLTSCLAAGLALSPLPVGQAAHAAPASVISAVKSAAKSDRELRAFYQARGNRPLWFEEGPDTAAARQLIELIATAELDGLDPEAYRPRALVDAVERASEGSPKDVARAELMLSRAFAAYVRASRQPAYDATRYIDRELAPTPPSVRAALQAADAAPSLPDYVAKLGWMHPIYGELRRGLSDYRYNWGGGRSFLIPDGPLLKPGAKGDRVRLLRERLGLPGSDAFDAELASAIRDFQATHGLPVDGVAGPRTLAALNEGSGNREDVIRLNMERARVLPAGGRGRHLVVDAASARLLAYEDGRLVDSMKVVVGKPTEQTPMLAGYIRYAAVNPYWNLPPDLARLRVAQPALKRGPSYVKANRFEVLSDWTADARKLDPAKVDWQAMAAGRIELPVRKLPGPDNAMGKVKFMLPNDLGIYLHDTPERELFQKAERRFSSGCVRVEDAQRLAKWLFGRPLTTKSDAPEQHVNLPQPVPVYITYLTASPAGESIAFRADAYGRDREQLARLRGPSFAGASR